MKAFCYNCEHFENHIDRSFCKEINEYTEPMKICDAWMPNDNMLVAILQRDNFKLRDKISELKGEE